MTAFDQRSMWNKMIPGKQPLCFRGKTVYLGDYKTRGYRIPKTLLLNKSWWPSAHIEELSNCLRLKYKGLPTAPHLKSWLYTACMWCLAFPWLLPVGRLLRNMPTAGPYCPLWTFSSWKLSLFLLSLLTKAKIQILEWQIYQYKCLNLAGRQLFPVTLFCLIFFYLAWARLLTRYVIK